MRSAVKTIKISVFGFLLLTFYGCGVGYQPVSKILSEDDGSKARWIEKVANTLRNGDGIGFRDDMERLLSMSRSEIVDEFMSDPRFGDSIFSFNLFFLGRSVVQLKAPTQGQSGGVSYRYDRNAFAMPQAVASARAVMDDGDFFQLLNEDPKLYLEPLQEPRDIFENGQPLDLTISEKRARHVENMHKQIDEIVSRFKAEEGGDDGNSSGGVIDIGDIIVVNESEDNTSNQDGDAEQNGSDVGGDAGEDVQLDKQAGCSQIYRLNTAIRTLSDFGFDRRLQNMVQTVYANPITSFEPQGLCQDPEATAEAVVQQIEKTRKRLAEIFAIVDGTAVQSVDIKDLSDFIELDLPTEGGTALNPPLTREGFWQTLTNSSTNFNRKRAAYMLKTYFCDDLSPINVVVADDHDGGDAHATDPACMACHYKLDPMGGLFRTIGRTGQDFAGSTNYTFDDFKTITGDELRDYWDSWQDEDGELRVGYYVGPNKAHKKWRGETLSDIWPFLQKSKEVRACLVRRMAEFYLGPDQVYDGDWLKEVSKDMKPGATSGAGVKKVVKSLVLSKTFAQEDPEPGKCYDFADGAVAEGSSRPPCEIAHIVKNRCATCHSDADDFRVDFTQWVKLDDGSFSFPHLDEDYEKQISRKESLEIILDRITSQDDDLRMPQGGSMPEMERQILYQWLEKQISEAQ